MKRNTLLFIAILFFFPFPKLFSDDDNEEIIMEEITEDSGTEKDKTKETEENSKKNDKPEKKQEPTESQPLVQPVPATETVPVNATEAEPASTEPVTPTESSPAPAETTNDTSTAVEPEKTPAEKPVTETAQATEPVSKPVSEPVAEQTETKEMDKIKEIEKVFWKGEISNIGSREIISPYNSAGVSIGMSMIDSSYSLTINPKLAMRFDKIDLIFGIHVPLNIELFNTDITRNDESFQFKTSDWDEWQDYLKILRYFQVGTSEDKFYLSIGSNFSQTIGHGTILKRYIPNQDSTFSTLSAKVNWYSDYGGFEALLGDVARGNIFGGLVFLKPFGGINNYHAKSASFGYTFVADRNAPTNLQYVSYYGMPDPNTNSDEWDKINATLYDNYRVRRIENDSKNRPIITDTDFLYMQGMDFDFKLFKNEKADIKTFLDYSWFKTDFVKGGFTTGFLGRFNLDSKNQHAIRTQLEFRVHHDSYLPSFFDTFYDVERIEMMTNIYGKDHFQPDGRSKYWHLMNNSEDKWVFSFYGEMSYSWKTWLSLSVGYEQMPDSFSLFTHFELPDLWILKTMLSYYRRGISSAEDLFSEDKVSSLFRAVVRLQVLPIMYINAYAGKHWTFWSADKPRPNDNLEGHYISSWDWGFDLEFGYEWGRAGKAKKDKKSEEKKAEDDLLLEN